MIITEFDRPLSAEDARKISINNRDDSVDRSQFRKTMEAIRNAASFGYTRYCSYPQISDLIPSERVQSALRSFGYRVVQKRAYLWDNEKNEYSDKPHLNSDGREQFIVDITWG